MPTKFKFDYRGLLDSVEEPKPGFLGLLEPDPF